MIFIFGILICVLRADVNLNRKLIYTT